MHPEAPTVTDTELRRLWTYKQQGRPGPAPHLLTDPVNKALHQKDLIAYDEEAEGWWYLSSRGRQTLEIANLLESIFSPDIDDDDETIRTARAALQGLNTFLQAKTAAGNWSNIPERWHGKKASLPMLSDWYIELRSDMQHCCTKTGCNKKDKIAEVFKLALAEALSANSASLIAGRPAIYPVQCINELSALLNTPPKTLGSILIALDEVLLPTKQEAIT